MYQTTIEFRDILFKKTVIREKRRLFFIYNTKGPTESKEEKKKREKEKKGEGKKKKKGENKPMLRLPRLL